MSFPRYPAYKDTGLEWLPAIPTSWEIRRLKQFCTVFPSNVDKKSIEGEMPVKLCNYTDVYYNESICAEMEFMNATASEEQATKFTLRSGDVLITKDSEAADDIAIAAYVPKTLPGVVCGYHLSMIRPRSGANGAYVKRIFDCTYTKSLFAVRANGLTRVGLSQYAVDNVELPLPPIHEQEAIATFLDHETAKIDALIAEQHRLIELLQEKRQAVISHAVTKGLNPDAPMKDSRVEWLGEVPEHWQVLRGSHVGSIFGSEQISEEKVSQQGDIPFIKVSTLSENGFECLEPVWFVDRADIRAGRGRNGFLAFPKRGAAIFGNKVNIIETESLIDPNLMGWLISDNGDPAFYAYTLKSRKLEEIADVSTVPQINTKHIAQEFWPCPPLDEQLEIGTFLYGQEAVFDSLADETSSSMALLQERRSALVSAAVTGQIDVRGLVPEADAA